MGWAGADAGCRANQYRFLAHRMSPKHVLSRLGPRAAGFGNFRSSGFLTLFIADATRNAVLKFVMFTAIEALQPIENMVVSRVREREVIVRQHEDILAALRARDAGAAARAIRERTAYLRERFDAAQAMNRRKFVSGVR